MTIALQNRDGIILLRAIKASFVNGVIPNWINFLISMKLKRIKIVFSARLGDMDKADQATSNEPRFSTNMINSSMEKKEKLVVKILAMKFHTKSVDETWLGGEIRLNPIMKDLIINGYEGEHHTRAVKRKQSKHPKTKVKAKAVKSVGENQLDWLDTLKEEMTSWSRLQVKLSMCQMIL